MKINAIVGNPPYQIVKEATSDEPIYHLFYDIAFQLSDIVTFITPARYLFSAGKTPQDWNDKVLHDPHFKVVTYKSNSTDLFPNVDIKGGVAIAMRNAKEDYGMIGHFTAFPELNSILRKVTEAPGFEPISNIIYAQNKFNLEALYADHPDYRGKIGSGGRERRLTTSIFSLTDLFVEKESGDDNVSILGLIKNVRTYRFVKRKYIEESDNLDFYKVIVPKSNGSGAIGEVLSTPLIGTPLIGVTQSFITFGKFDKSEEANAALKYIKSRFARCLLGILKVTQDNSREVWRLVPLQDFTPSSDIDWGASVADIDRQLYRKYALTEEEQHFIDRMIKPME